MNKKFYKKIIDLIPSEDLKNYIKSNAYEFKEKDLLKIILNYAPTFYKKLELFKEASHLLCESKMRTLAQKRLDFEIKAYNAYMKSDNDTVYQIEIKTAPNAADEDTYITKTFDDAVLMIKSFIKCYDITANERNRARYTVKKKTTNLPLKPNDIYRNKVGTLGECVLDGKFKIIYLEMYHFGKETTCKKGADCAECDRCIDNMTTTHFPHFLKQYDLIAYYDDILYNPKHLTYGIFDLDMEKYDTHSHVITIEDNNYIQNRNADYRDEKGYYRIFDAHEHPSYFEITKPNLKDVPKKILDDYHYTLPVLKKIEDK